MRKQCRPRTSPCRARDRRGAMKVRRSFHSALPLCQIANQIAIAVENGLAYREIETLKNKLADAALQRYHWPGNIRELENVIERAVILSSSGAELELPLSELKPARPTAATPVSTLEDAERKHILSALEQADWVIGGPRGAAARLGMKRTTLHSRMQKLGISRHR